MTQRRPAKIAIHWWEDASGRRTCHENRPKASFAESFLGELKGNIHDGWYYRLSGSDSWEGPFSNMHTASKALESAVDGAPIDIWD